MTIRPSIRLGALPRSLPFAARFGIARDAGFEGVEVDVGDGPAAELREAADATGIAIHSVSCRANFTKPLSSPDPAVRDAGVAAVLESLAAARIMGAPYMLLIPGVVGADASYGEVYARSQAVIRRDILPEAERLGIVLTVENVWNGFLISPYDCARYVSEFESSCLRLCLDVGNVIFGHPEGWIDIAGPYIAALHTKDLLHWTAPTKGYRVARVGEGHIDWRRVRAALDRAGFSGWAVMAEVEFAQPRLAYLAFSATRHLAAGLGNNPVLRLIETHLCRRVAADTMRRFRRYVAPNRPASGG